MRKLIICLWLFTSVATVWAEDTATLNFLGFSKNGKYLAFQQYGVTDGKGAAYAMLYFIDVVGNNYQEKPIETIEDYKSGSPAGTAAQDTVRQLNLDQGKAQLKDLGIEGENFGTKVISHQIYDIDINSHATHFTLERQGKVKYEVSLEEHATKPEMDCNAAPTDVVGFTLNFKRGEDTKPKILQHDNKVPKSRGCPVGYHIQDIYVYKNKYLAVFIHVYTPGFEGKNTRYLVVTGVLE
jgi:predicted secreted protein